MQPQDASDALRGSFATRFHGFAKELCLERALRACIPGALGFHEAEVGPHDQDFGAPRGGADGRAVGRRLLDVFGLAWRRNTGQHARGGCERLSARHSTTGRQHDARSGCHSAETFRPHKSRRSKGNGRLACRGCRAFALQRRGTARWYRGCRRPTTAGRQCASGKQYATRQFTAAASTGQCRQYCSVCGCHGARTADSGTNDSSRIDTGASTSGHPTRRTAAWRRSRLAADHGERRPRL